MKAKDLILLLQAVDPDAEIVTPGFDEYGAASDFVLVPVGIRFNVRKATPHFAPHDVCDEIDTEATKGYLLNGDW